ncbi:M48 family metallopeptidase [Billgrantia kenyensis]|uniref:M48 family metallopeptidase n=1 Tax=Billgrantia kenyensis TaxID=321266 RepID=A0A7V9W1N7_9GAMM|nr:M48 family metallopeptidase [Halomonas kenyensis]MBA2779375.1 M48 family metallopeptidase [Halomonas kenyensis]MCG6662477.1 M48 family metallopeptidase [Halomonas kenyensis]
MRWIRLITVATLALTLTACATSPTGRQQLTLMSDAQLNEMGQEAFSQYQQDLPQAGQAYQRYAQCIAEALIEVLPERERDQDWQILVFESEQANAFALPGGYMGINTGLLRVAQNQDQVAAVVGHEIGHVLARHANERVSTQTSTQLALSVLGSAAGMQGPGGEQLMGALGLGAQYGILLPFSRRHETEADIIGVRLMADAGFDPRASLELWENMSAEGGARPPAWMSTHPSHGQRTQVLESEIPGALARYEEARGAGRQPNCPRP